MRRMEPSVRSGAAGRRWQPVSDCALLTLSMASLLFLLTPWLEMIDRIGPVPTLLWWVLALAVSAANLFRWRTLGAWRKIVSSALCVWAFLQVPYTLGFLLGPRTALKCGEVLSVLFTILTVWDWTGLVMLAAAVWILKRLVASVVLRCRRARAGSVGRSGGAALSAHLGLLCFLLAIGNVMATVLFAMEPSLRAGDIDGNIVPLFFGHALLHVPAAIGILIAGLLESHLRESLAGRAGQAPEPSDGGSGPAP